MGDEVFKGICRVYGKEYPCEIFDNIWYINGMTVDDFIDSLDIDTVINLSISGQGNIIFYVSCVTSEK